MVKFSCAKSNAISRSVLVFMLLALLEEFCYILVFFMCCGE